MKEFSCHLCTASHFYLVQTSLMLVNTFDFKRCKLKMNWCPTSDWTSDRTVGRDVDGRSDVRLFSDGVRYSGRRNIFIQNQNLIITIKFR